MAKTHLTWTALKTFLNVLTRASELDRKLSKATIIADITVRQEPWKVAVM